MSAVNFNHPRSKVIILLSQVCYYAIMNGNAEINKQAHRRNNVPCSLLSKAGVTAGQREGALRALSLPHSARAADFSPSDHLGSKYLSWEPSWQHTELKEEEELCCWRLRKRRGQFIQIPSHPIKHVAETGPAFTSTLLKTVCAPKSHS